MTSESENQARSLSPLRTRAAVALVSLALIGTELALMRMLSLRFWHHFAYLIISVALLGLGVSGTFITLGRNRISRHWRGWMAGFAIAFAVAVPAAWWLSQAVPLNIQFIGWQPRRQAWNVFLLQLVMLVPFFCAGGMVGVALMDKPDRIGGHYAANLFGSGAGALAGVLLMYIFDTWGVLLLMAGLSLAAGLLLLPWPSRRSFLAAAAGLAGVLLLGLLPPTETNMSDFKPLPQFKAMPEVETLARREGPLGRIDVLTGPYIHVAPGLSLQYTGPVPDHAVLLVDGDGTTPIYAWEGEEALQFMDYTTSAAAYRVVAGSEVLIIGAGGGSHIAQALYHESSRITALEMNPQIIELMTGPMAERGGHVYLAPGVNVVPREARGFLARRKERFDLIQLPALEAFGASGAGLYASQESYLYTVDAFALMLNRLTERGVLSVTRWMRTPPRDGIRAFNIAAEALRSQNLDPAPRLIMIRSWVTTTILASRQPFSEAQLQAVRAFAEERGFDLVYLPGLKAHEVNRFHQLEQAYYYEAADALLGPDRQDFIDNYAFRVDATTDDRPYYFSFFRWAAVPILLRQLENRAPVFLELGYLMIVAALVQSIAMAVVLILLPLALDLGALRHARGKVVTFAYFLLLGLAFMLLEMMFFQKLMLYLSHPIFSAAVVIAAFLVFSGVGSMLSRRWHLSEKSVATWAVGAIVLLSIFYLFAFDAWLGLTQSQALWLRIIIAGVTVAPLAFAMGHLFPTGLRMVGAAQPVLVPWAWAVNGCASVVATVSAPLIAMSIGFARLTLIGVILYALAGGLVWMLPGKDAAEAEPSAVR